jgi:hypothetical protein
MFLSDTTKSAFVSPIVVKGVFPCTIYKSFYLEYIGEGKKSLPNNVIIQHQR